MQLMEDGTVSVSHVAASRLKFNRFATGGTALNTGTSKPPPCTATALKISASMTTIDGIPFVTQETAWISIVNWIAALVGASTTFPALVSNPFLWDSLKLLILGSIVETGRRLFRWVVNRFKIRMLFS